jgi:cytochrome c5
VLVLASWIVAGPSRAEERDAGGATGTLADAAPNLVQKALGAMEGAEEIVFAVRALYDDGHYYANFGHWSLDPNKMMYAPGGSQLCKLNLRTGKLTVLVDDPEGSVRDPHVHYDGGKILFSYRPGGTRHYHLYEIGADGTGLRQLTDGPFDDIEPAYLPDGGIVFPSSRCKRFVACWYTPVATLHRMDADGGNIRILSSNIVHDNTPSVLPDGRVLYTRWEYVDRAPQKFHGLWSMNPDGTGQMIVFGNMQPPGEWILMIDAKPIPGSDRVVAVFSPHHGNREHAGHVMIVDPDAGADTPDRPRQISPQVEMASGWMGGRDGFRDPFPLSGDCFLVAQDKSLLILDAQGRTHEIYRAEKMVHEPCAIRPRPRERIIPQHYDPARKTGRLVVADVHHGRSMEGVRPGEIKTLLVLEQLPTPVNFSGVQQNLSMNGTFTLKRILGTVPVEPDGSAHFEVPALRSLHFVALDGQGRTVKRMQSFCTVMPGETTGCVGCHEKRTDTPRFNRILLATARPASQIEPIANVPDVIDYPRDIQPVFDKHCVECHSAEKPDGRVVLTGDRNEWFTQSYYALFSSDQVSDSQGYDEDGNRAARGFGSVASALMKKIDGSHYDVELSGSEQALIRLWIDTGATFPGTYAAYRPGRPPSGHTRPDPRGPTPTYGTVNTGTVPAGGESLDAIIKRRCLTCHDADLPLGPGIHKTQEFLNVPRHCLNLYNLTHPEKSMILLAPLAKGAGGYGWCKAKSGDGQPGKPARVFTNTQDPDYQAFLQAIQTAKTQLDEIKRFDMPGFRPNRHYIREMKRYGVLPADFDPAKNPIDVYETDRAYWRSLWYQPTVVAGSASPAS